MTNMAAMPVHGKNLYKSLLLKQWIDCLEICLDATYEIWSHLAHWFQRRSRLKVWTDDGRTTEAAHTISSPGAFGSGELKGKEAHSQIDKRTR